MNYHKKQSSFPEILVIGKGRLASSLPVALATAGSRVTVCANEENNLRSAIENHCRDIYEKCQVSVFDHIYLYKSDDFPEVKTLTFIVGLMDKAEIQEILERLENGGNTDAIIAISTDHIPLTELQKGRLKPSNILIVNWTEPAHTTLFLEIIYNHATDPAIVRQLEHSARFDWGKDPYKVEAEIGVRGRMTAAMIREALYLIEHGYANIEDIDRACRNDAGTYLPFAGNFQYMDLMGTYAYGVVMEKLNKELSKASTAPDFFTAPFPSSDQDAERFQPFFYQYTSGDMEKWEKRMRNFSFEIRSLMEKYPFEYLRNSDESRDNP